jgi:hypothetical protein
MEPEIIETVLKEILDEIKMIHQENEEKDKYAADIEDKIQSLEKALYIQEIKPPEINLLPLQLQLDSSTKNIEKTIREQPKNISRKIQILLFPESGAREYYRLVFGRLLFWMMMFLLATYMYSLGKQFIDNWKEVTERKNELIDHSRVSPDKTKSVYRKSSKK